MAAEKKQGVCDICSDEPCKAVMLCCQRPIGSKCFFSIAVYKKDVASSEAKRAVCPFCRGDPMKAAKEKRLGEIGPNEVVISYLGSSLLRATLPVEGTTTGRELLKKFSQESGFDTSSDDDDENECTYYLVYRDRIMGKDATLNDCHYMGGRISMTVQMRRPNKVFDETRQVE